MRVFAVPFLLSSVLVLAVIRDTNFYHHQHKTSTALAVTSDSQELILSFAGARFIPFPFDQVLFGTTNIKYVYSVVCFTAIKYGCISTLGIDFSNSNWQPLLHPFNHTAQSLYCVSHMQIDKSLALSTGWVTTRLWDFAIKNTNVTKILARKLSCFCFSYTAFNRRFENS
jgi:hypothetical protein